MTRILGVTVLLFAVVSSLPGGDCLTVRDDKILAGALASRMAAFADIEPTVVIG